MPKRTVQSQRVFPIAAFPSITGSARLIGIAVAFGELLGCSLLGPPAAVEQPAPIVVRTPDPRAPRLPPLETRHFTLAGEKQEVVGATQVLFTRYENTFSAIAQHYDLGYEELKHANPGVDHWLPGEETPVYLPTEMILPDTPRQGIVINVPAMRLWYFTTPKDLGEASSADVHVTTYPIGIGEEGWATPLGEGTVTSKARDPVWYVPASIRKEHAARGDPLPSVVQPGPDNPLGRHALALSLPGYLIHGTNKPAGVGMRSSHGCIRLYPEDIEALFERVGKGHESANREPARARGVARRPALFGSASAARRGPARSRGRCKAGACSSSRARRHERRRPRSKRHRQSARRAARNSVPGVAGATVARAALGGGESHRESNARNDSGPNRPIARACGRLNLVVCVLMLGLRHRRVARGLRTAAARQSRGSYHRFFPFREQHGVRTRRLASRR